MEFKEQRHGYDKAQVREYLEAVSAEYRKMQTEYETIFARCEQLEQDEKAALEQVEALQTELEALRSSPPEAKPEPPAIAAPAMSGPPADVIGQVLIDAKTLAQSILEKAKSEADQITADAASEAEQINGRSIAEATEILTRAKQESDRIASGIRQELEEMAQTKYNIVKEFKEIQTVLGTIVRRSGLGDPAN